MEEYEVLNSDDIITLRSTKSSIIKKETVPSYLVGIRTVSRLEWDSLVSSVALIHSFLIIFCLSFECESFGYPHVKACGLGMDLVCIIDIHYNFTTTYIDKHTGDEIIKIRRIAKNYIFGSFVFDLISAIPIFFISKTCSDLNTVVCIFRLTKLQRILVVVSRLMFFRLRKRIRVIIKFFEMILWLMIYIHLMACLWYKIVCISQTWEPFSVLESGEYFYEITMSERYSFCIYTIISSISRIEMLPTTGFEHMFSGIIIIFGMLIVGFIYGNIIVLLNELGKNSLKFSTEREKIFNTIKNLKLPNSLQIKILDFFASSFTILDQEISYQRLMNFLPPSLKKKINSCLFEEFLNKSLISNNDNKLKAYLASRFDNKFCQPEEEIIKQFESGDLIYFLCDGSCEVEVLDELKEKITFKVLNVGSYFGEISVLFKIPRTATVKSVEFTTLAVLSSSQLDILFSRYPKIKKLMYAGICKYKDPNRIFIEKRLGKLKYLSGVDIKTFDRLIYSLPVYTCSSQSNLFTAGDTCNSCFIILDGKVQILFEVSGPLLFSKLKNKNNNKKIKAINLVVEELGKGSVLCPNLLLLQQKMIVSCRCIQHAKIMIFNKEHLDQLIVKLPDIKYAIETERNKYTVWDSVLKQPKQKIIPLDYYKCQKYDKAAKKNSTKARIKFKNAVISQILEIREINKQKLPKVDQVLEKLQGIQRAEAIGRHDIAHKINSGLLPPSVVEAHDLLKNAYINNPLVAQFAMMSKGTSTLSQQFKALISKIKDDFDQTKKYSEAVNASSGVLLSKFKEVESLLLS